MPSFAFGGEKQERVEVEVHGYERPPTGDYYDDNWLRSSVSIAAGAFSGNFDTAFLTADFSEFRDQLQSLYESLASTASFETLEEQLSLALVDDGRGGFLLKGVAVDVLGTSNRLESGIAFDQSDLLSALEGLNDIVSQFPVRPD